MAEGDLELTGEGTVRDLFRITGHGWVVVLEEKFSGKVAVGGILESASGRATIQGVEIVDSREGSRLKGRLGLLISETAKSLFEVGQQVRSYKQL